MEIPVWVIQVFAVYVIGSTFGFVWWMATMQEKLSQAGISLKDLTESMSKHEERYYTKVEAAKDFEWRDQQIKAQWTSIDKLKEAIK